MSNVSRLQTFANVLMGTANAALDAYSLWEGGKLGPRPVSKGTDKATGINFDSLTDETSNQIAICDWWGDVSFAVDELQRLAKCGIADVLIPPVGTEPTPWVLELIGVADELLDAVKLAGLVPIDISVEESKEGGFAHATLQEDWQTVRKIPRLVDLLWKARRHVLNQAQIATPVDQEGKGNGTAGADPRGGGSADDLQPQAAPERRANPVIDTPSGQDSTVIDLKDDAWKDGDFEKAISEGRITGPKASVKAGGPKASFNLLPCPAEHFRAAQQAHGAAPELQTGPVSLPQEADPKLATPAAGGAVDAKPSNTVGKQANAAKEKVVMRDPSLPAPATAQALCGTKTSTVTGCKGLLWYLERISSVCRADVNVVTIAEFFSRWESAQGLLDTLPQDALRDLSALAGRPWDLATREILNALAKPIEPIREIQDIHTQAEMVEKLRRAIRAVWRYDLLADLERLTVNLETICHRPYSAAGSAVDERQAHGTAPEQPTPAKPQDLACDDDDHGQAGGASSGESSQDAAAPEVETATEKSMGAMEPGARGVAPRRRLFLQWYEEKGEPTFHSHAEIAKRWNEMSREQRAAICPASPGNVQRATVIKDIERAREKAPKTR